MGASKSKPAAARGKQPRKPPEQGRSESARREPEPAPAAQEEPAEAAQNASIVRGDVEEPPSVHGPEEAPQVETRSTGKPSSAGDVDDIVNDDLLKALENVGLSTEASQLGELWTAASQSGTGQKGGGSVNLGDATPPRAPAGRATAGADDDLTSPPAQRHLDFDNGAPSPAPSAPQPLAEHARAPTTTTFRLGSLPSSVTVKGRAPVPEPPKEEQKAPETKPKAPAKPTEAAANTSAPPARAAAKAPARAGRANSKKEDKATLRKQKSRSRDEARAQKRANPAAPATTAKPAASAAPRRSHDAGKAARTPVKVSTDPAEREPAPAPAPGTPASGSNVVARALERRRTIGSSIARDASATPTLVDAQSPAAKQQHAPAERAPAPPPASPPAAAQSHHSDGSSGKVSVTNAEPAADVNPRDEHSHIFTAGADAADSGVGVHLKTPRFTDGTPRPRDPARPAPAAPPPAADPAAFADPSRHDDASRHTQAREDDDNDMAPPSEAASGSEGGSEGGAAPAARGMRAVASSSALADADAAPSNATADTPKSDVPAKLLAKSLRTSASSRNVSRRSEVAPPPEAADSPRTSSRDAGTPEPAPSSPQDPVEAEGGGVAARGEVARRPSLEELALPSHSIDATVTPVPQGTPAKVRREGSGVPASPGLGTILSGPESQRVRESIRKLSAEVNAILKRTAHGRDAAGGESEGSAASGGESARLLTMLSQTLNQASAALEGTCTSSNPATLESSRAAPEGRRRSGAEDADAPTGGSDPFATDGDETAAAASLASDLRTLYTINRIAQATPREKILADAASLGLTDAELDSLLSQAYEVSAQALKESERIDKVLLGSSSVAAVAALSGDGADDDGGAGAQRPPQPLASHPLVTPPVTSAAPLGLTPPAGAPMTPDEQEAALELELGLVGTANSRMAAQASAGSSQLQYATPVQPHAPHGGAAPLVRSSGSYLARHAATPAHAEQGGYALSGRSGGAAPGSGDAGYARRGQGAHGAAPAAQRSLRSMVAGGRSEQRLGVRASHDASWSGRSGERPRARTPQPGRPRPDWQGSTRVGPHPGGGSSAAAKAASPEKDLEEIVRRVVMQVVGKRAGGGAGGGTAAAQAETVDVAAAAAAAAARALTQAQTQPRARGRKVASQAARARMGAPEPPGGGPVARGSWGPFDVAPARPRDKAPRSVSAERGAGLRRGGATPQSAASLRASAQEPGGVAGRKRSFKGMSPADAAARRGAAALAAAAQAATREPARAGARGRAGGVSPARTRNSPQQQQQAKAHAMQAHFPRHQQRQHAAQPAQPARRPAPLQVKASSNDTAQPSISRVDLGEASRPLSLDGSATSPHAQAARLWAPGPESPALAVPDTDNAVSPAPAAARKTVQLPGNGPAPAALSSYVIEVGDDSAATSGGVSDRDLDSTAGTPKPATPIREDSRERLRMRSEREQEEVDAFLALERGLTGGP